MVTDLGGAQISSLLETLPGIAQVLRSPVADAFVSLIRQASRHHDFQLAEAEEVLRFSVRRNLLSQDESDRVLAEVREGLQRRADRAADRAEARKPAAAAKAAAKVAPAKPAPVKVTAARPAARPAAKARPAKAKVAKPARKPKPVKPARAARAARPVVKKKAPARKK